MYTSTLKIKSTVIFQYTNVFIIVLELHQHGDLTNRNSLKHLTLLYKNVSPNITVGIL
jgi:hypothetical protein